MAPMVARDGFRDKAMRMTVVIACCVLLSIGLAATARWGSLDVQVPPTPPGEGHPPISFVIRRYVWTVSLFLWTIFVTGVLIAGPAGRLAMRLLGATAGDAAQGRETEAGEIVGRITVGGTIGLFVFVGLFAAFVSVLAYFVVRRWLPGGRMGGLLLGAMLLITFGSRIDPLRPDNKDFDIVGPAWLSIVVYAVMALVQGMAVVAVAGRVSRFLPLPEKSIRTLAPHVILLLLGLAFFLAPFVLVLGGLTILASRTNLAEVIATKRVAIAGRVALAAVTLVALPGFASAVADIAGRGP
jgi:hypothetical protein